MTLFMGRYWECIIFFVLFSLSSNYFGETGLLLHSESVLAPRHQLSPAKLRDVQINGKGNIEEVSKVSLLEKV